MARSLPGFAHIGYERYEGRLSSYRSTLTLNVPDGHVIMLSFRHLNAPQWCGGNHVTVSVRQRNGSGSFRPAMSARGSLPPDPVVMETGSVRLNYSFCACFEHYLGSSSYGAYLLFSFHRNEALYSLLSF